MGSTLRKSRKQARPVSDHAAMKGRTSRATATCSSVVDVALKVTAMWWEARTSCKLWWIAMLISPEKGRWHGLWTRVRTGLRGDTARCLALSGTTTAGDSVVTRPKRSPQTGVPARGILPQIQDRPESPTEESHGFSRVEDVNRGLPGRTRAARRAG